MSNRSALRLSACLTLALVHVTSCAQGTRAPHTPAGTTTITVGPEVLRTDVKRMGINLSGQSFYDSGQMMRNLTFRNPGFEGETWQSILHCKSVTATSCTDENQYTVWPAGFMAGAVFEVLTGPAAGTTGTITDSSAAAPPLGITLNFLQMRSPLHAGDFLRVRLDKPGRADAGWWVNASGGASVSTEVKDLSPHTPGKQALRMEAAGPGRSLKVTSYFDTLEGHSFVHLRGLYRLQFRAKTLAGASKLNVSVQRLDTAHGMATFLNRSVALTPGWHDYTLDFSAAEPSSAIGGVALTFALQDASALLDDVALAPAQQPANNPTAFRDEVVQTLRDLRPGVLRYMDNGTDFGSSLDNMLAPPFARQRAGASTQATVQEDIPMGLHEFLVLCQTLGAEPWYSMPPGTNLAEAQHLVEYLSSASSTPYGAKRSALGQPQPWTSVFPVIHLELGNEQWNARSFAGSAINDPVAYGRRAESIFAAARRTPGFDPARFDLVLGSWSAVPWWTQQELASTSGIDSVAIAPYLFTEFNDASSTEAIFGPMLAQPEQIDSRPDSPIAQQAAAARNAPLPAKLSVYEVNLGTMSGSATQAELDRVVPSMGAGLAVADHMLLMLRDLGITTQALFALPEFRNDFAATSGQKQTMPLWGAVVDMGGATDLRRPQFLALQLINRAVLPNMLTTHLSGANPTWNQPQSTNDKVHLQGAHLLQTFAFTDGTRHSLILLNLSRTETLPVAFAGPQAPSGAVQQSLLTSAQITDTNETQEKVRVHSSALTDFNPAATYSLPPFSMTVLTWTAATK